MSDDGVCYSLSIICNYLLQYYFLGLRKQAIHLAIPTKNTAALMVKGNNRITSACWQEVCSEANLTLEYLTKDIIGNRGVTESHRGRIEVCIDFENN